MSLETDEGVRRIAVPLFKYQPSDRVWAARCCGRVLVSTQEPALCGTCQKPPAEKREILPTDLSG